jgi:hypothetical protein
MKPQPPFARGKSHPFPFVDVCFQGDFSDWRGSSWPGGGDDGDSPARRFSRFNCELLRESRRERQREMIVFSVIMVLAAWPVFWMVWSLISVLLHGHLMPA